MSDFSTVFLIVIYVIGAWNLCAWIAARIERWCQRGWRQRDEPSYYADSAIPRLVETDETTDSDPTMVVPVPSHRLSERFSRRELAMAAPEIGGERLDQNSGYGETTNLRLVK